MTKTIIRRLLILIPQLFVIACVTFALSQLMPGDFVSLQIGGELTWSEIQAMREQLGLDRPWYIQFWTWLGSVARGDFGLSAIHHRPVMDVIGDRIINTFRLSLVATVMFFLISVPLGILSGRFSRRLPDKVILLYGFVGLALPTLVLAILLIFIFGIRLEWLPARGSVDAFAVGTGFGEFVSRIRHMILPATAMATFSGIGMIYILRSQIIEGKASDYALTARSKGVPERVIFNKHILRNSIIPLAQSIGLTFVGLLTGTVLIEWIFIYPGMGDLFITSITNNDFNVASALILIFSALTAVGVLIGDIALTIADPRIRIR